MAIILEGGLQEKGHEQKARRLRSKAEHPLVVKLRSLLSLRVPSTEIQLDRPRRSRRFWRTPEVVINAPGYLISPLATP